MITEEYKLMCINNPDLQGLWEPEYGHRMIIGNHIRFVSISYISKVGINKTHDFWLPYQEDLQKLFELDDRINQRIDIRIGVYSPKFTAYCNLDEYIKLIAEGNDLNEVWLNMVMRYQFNKKWDFGAKGWIES